MLGDLVETENMSKFVVDTLFNFIFIARTVVRNSARNNYYTAICFSVYLVLEAYSGIFPAYLCYLLVLYHGTLLKKSH